MLASGRLTEDTQTWAAILAAEPGQLRRTDLNHGCALSAALVTIDPVDFDLIGLSKDLQPRELQAFLPLALRITGFSSCLGSRLGLGDVHEDLTSGVVLHGG